MRFIFVDAEKLDFPVTVLCRVMDVSRNGYYTWRKREASAHSLRDKVLLDKIRKFHEASHKRYGSPRIYDDLRDDNEHVGRKRVERLMRQEGIVGKHRRKFKCTTDSNHDLPVASNLLNQQFEASAPNMVWTSDITQLRTLEGWLYLAVVLDLFARRIVGWSLRADITRQLVLEAVTMAIQQRKPDGEIIFHSDRGSQYASVDTEKLLSNHGITASMSGVGNCYDNAVSESFFSGLKNELGDTFPSRNQGCSDVFSFIEAYYNPYRRHRFNGNISPVDCEEFFARNGRRPSGVKDLIDKKQDNRNRTISKQDKPINHRIDQQRLLQ
ncbi:MAG: IS3 family transposase [Aestuariibacter sp.]|nr:IS3 family transposase [Aestuariibacter sp.]